jgi:16S rRNA (cytidine1402-2'-O)-methyltransferase
MASAKPNAKPTSAKPGTLYVCATPIGNLQDCTTRLIETLKTVDLIAAEDTRITAILCQRFDITAPIVRLDKFTERQQSNTLLYKLQEGLSIAMVSDAGTPNISDPGALLIEIISEHDIPIVPIPGPSTITTLLSVSGLPAELFTFIGYFPRKQSESETLLKTLPIGQPIVFFESPNRIEKTLEFLEKTNRVKTMVLGKELTKTFETILRGTPSSLKQDLKTILIKGEWCGVMVLTPTVAQSPEEFVTDAVKQGLSRTQTLHIGTQYLGFPKNVLYNAFITSSGGK